MPQKGYISVKMIKLDADAVQTFRKGRDLTQAKLAKDAKIARNTVIRIESGEAKSVTLDTINALAKALNVSADKLVAFEP